jgi:uncharacterized membrane protein YdbT with pleckstrin-like domain
MFEYAKHNLLSGEEILYQAKFHWFIYAPATFFFLMIPFFPFETFYTGTLVVLGLGAFIRFFILKLSTEFVVTNQRVIVKTGLISRNTVELNHRNVESVRLDQGIIGRILGYGSLTLLGTGAGLSPIPYIDDPLEFRRHVLEVVQHGR